MLTTLRQYYRNHPLYRNSIAMMLNSTFVAFPGLISWITVARGMNIGELGFAIGRAIGSAQRNGARVDLKIIVKAQITNRR